MGLEPKRFTPSWSRVLIVPDRSRSFPSFPIVPVVPDRSRRSRSLVLRGQAHVRAETRFDRAGDLLVLLEEGAGVLTALAETLAVVREPGAALFHDVALHAL